MRYSPLALALSALIALSASSGPSDGQETIDPRAASLEAIGRGALAAGDTLQANDAFEAALAVDPGATPLLIDLAQAARREGLQGKALHYYRAAMDREPKNLAAIAGEGEALAEKARWRKRSATSPGCRACAGPIAPRRVSWPPPSPRAPRRRW